MTRARVVAAVMMSLAVTAATVREAPADVSLGVRNGDRIIGTLSPADAEETVRVDVPQNARVTITVTGRRLRRAGPPPRMNFEVYGPTDGLLGTGTPRRRGARLVIPAAPASGEYSVVFLGDGTNVGNYVARVSWRVPRRQPIRADLTEESPSLLLPLAADRGARLNLVVKAARGSAARPRFATLNEVDLPQPANANAKAHRLRRQPASGLPFGNSTVVVTNAGPPGAIRGAVLVLSPRPSRRKILITAGKIGPADGSEAATGEVIDQMGGVVEVVGGDIDGAGVRVPAGAVNAPTAIFVATSPDIAPPRSGELEGVGPTVLMGPEGLRFRNDVTVVMPFDLAPFAGDYSTLRIFTRNARGRITEVTSFDEDDVDEINGTISFTIGHFSSFRVFGPPSDAVKSDLNDDRRSDLVMPAPLASGGVGAVYVKFAPLVDGLVEPGTVFSAASAADVTVAGAGAGGHLGGEVLTADVNGDGVSDLLVSEEVGNGNVCIFFGGPDFAPTGPGDADVILTGGPDDPGFGNGIAVGDVTGDGVPDVLVGAEDGRNGAGQSTGAASLFFGPVTGVISSADADVRFVGEQQNDLFGCCAAIGDITGDGSPDVIIGADMVDRPAATGRVYIWDSGFTAGSRAASGADVILTGEGAGDGFGLPLEIGLLDDDGVLDLVVGQGLDSVSPVTSSVYVFYGGALSSGSAAGADARITGVEAGNAFGLRVQIIDVSAAAPGSNLLVSAPLEDDGPTEDAGALYVFGGNALTSGTAAARSLFDVRGAAAFDLFGVVVPGAPFRHVVYAPGDDSGGSEAGRAYVFPASLSPSTTLGSASFSFAGQAGELLGGED